MAGMSLTNQSAAYPSCFLFKLNTDGQAVWAKQFGGGDFMGPSSGADVFDIQGGVSVNTAGDCTVVGLVSITNAIFDSFTLTSAGDEDMFIARFEAEPPRLKIAAAASSITVSWPTNQSGFRLERTLGLSAGSQWEAVTNTSEVVGMENRVSQVTTNNSIYFRLRKL